MMSDATRSLFVRILVADMMLPREPCLFT